MSKRSGQQTTRSTKKTKVVASEPTRSLYLANLHPETSYDELCAFGNEYGPLHLVKILGAKSCAFVNFLDIENAKLCYEACTQSPVSFHERQVDVRWAATSPLQPDLVEALNQGATRNLFVIGVSPTILESELRKTFGKYGMFQSIVIHRKKGIVFINMASLRGAMRAKAELGGSQIGSRTVTINYAKEGSGVDRSRVASTPTKSQAPSNSRAIFVGNLPEGTTAHDLCKFANQFGVIESLKRNPAKNTAFINFLQPDTATAVLSIDELAIKGQAVQIAPAKATPVSRVVLEAVEEKGSRCLFAGNLPRGATKDEVESLFSEFGEFENVRVFADKKFAFVNMCSIHSAIQALAASANMSLRGSKLKVAYAKEGVNPQAAGLVAHYAATPAQPESTAAGVTRALYLSNLGHGTTLRDVCTVANRFGPLETVHLNESKHCCFVNFITTAAASAMKRNYTKAHLTLRGHSVNIRFGKAGPVKDFISAEMQKGATRALHLSNLGTAATDEQVRGLFASLGTVVFVQVDADKGTAFVHLTSIYDAVKAWRSLNGRPVESGRPIVVGYAAECPK